MPVDTRSKRAGSVQVLGPAVLAPPAPDGTIGQGDRQHIAWSYSGILAAAAVTHLGTRSKRAASVQMLVPSLLAPPATDGTLGQGDRQQIAWSYSGILAAEIPALDDVIIATAVSLTPARTLEKL
jgi:hypothetical protein